LQGNSLGIPFGLVMSNIMALLLYKFKVPIELHGFSMIWLEL
jgi:hypothetical protein